MAESRSIRHELLLSTEPMTLFDAPVTISPIHAFEDNLIWCLQRPGVTDVAVVDPGDAVPVIDWLNTHQKALTSILITHHHGDHTGGIKELIRYCLANHHKAPIVYGPTSCVSKGVTHVVGEADTIRLKSLGLSFKVLFVPGHTDDHLAYFTDPITRESKAVFCGDTLFAAGCGRLLGGTAEQMFDSLNRLSSLPPQTEIYCAHEYTLSNLKFARSVCPGSLAIQERLLEVEKLRSENQLTLPSTMAEELLTNPFLGCASVADFRQLRQAKDQFRLTL